MPVMLPADRGASRGRAAYQSIQHQDPDLIGPVSNKTLSACTRHERAIGALGGSNEIFFNLDARRVYFDRSLGHLYFCATQDDLIPATLRAVFSGMGSGIVVEQLHLDEHRCFNAARRVTLSADQAGAALVALRLAGVRATIA